MDKYYNQLTLENTYKNFTRLKLCDYYVASSFRPMVTVNQKYDYMSLKILEKTLKSGARFLWLDVFNSDLSYSPFPIVSTGSKDVNQIYTLNPISLKKCFETIVNTAFKPGIVQNYNDPLILALNINVNNNNITLNKIKNLILEYFQPYLLKIEYGYCQTNIGSLLLDELLGTEITKPKIIFFSNDTYTNTPLEEFINQSWQDSTYIKHIIHKSIDPDVNSFNFIKEDIDSLKEFNKSNLTIVTPEENLFYTQNYNPLYSFNNGCQFVSVPYQKTNSNMDEYVNKFKYNSFILKPLSLRFNENSLVENSDLSDENSDLSNENTNENKIDCPINYVRDIENKDMVNNITAYNFCTLKETNLDDKNLIDETEKLNIYINDVTDLKNVHLSNTKKEKKINNSNEFINKDANIICNNNKYLPNLSNSYVITPKRCDNSIKVSLEIESSQSNQLKNERKQKYFDICNQPSLNPNYGDGFQQFNRRLEENKIINKPSSPCDYARLWGGNSNDKNTGSMGSISRNFCSGGSLLKSKKKENRDFGAWFKTCCKFNNTTNKCEELDTTSNEIQNIFVVEKKDEEIDNIYPNLCKYSEMDDNNDTFCFLSKKNNLCPNPFNKTIKLYNSNYNLCCKE